MTRGFAKRFAAVVIGVCAALGATVTPAAASDVQPFIVGGDTVREKLPWIGALHRGGSFTCTSTAIAPRWVLTAAHCVEGSGTYSVRLGTLTRSSGGTLATAKRIIKHPSYNWPDNDIALIEIDRDAPGTITLATSSDISVGQASTLYGWGSVKPDWSGPLPENLKYATGKITSVNCTFGNPNPPTVCFSGDGSVAGGDSGGPAVVGGGSRPFIQYGVCAVGSKPSKENGYTNVTRYRPWIKQYAGV